MTKTFYNFIQCMEEYNNVDKSGCKIVYSQLNIKKFEEYCEKHLLCCDNEVMCGYKNNKICENVFLIVCFVTFLYIGLEFWQCCNYVCGGTVNKYLQIGLLVVVCLCASGLITRQVMRKLFPINEVIKRQLRYKDYVEKNYYPLLELQEIMRRNTVSNIHLKVLDSLLEVEFYDEQGRTKKQLIYFISGAVEYCEEGVIDFSGIDKAVICKAEKLGLNYWDHI